MRAVEAHNRTHSAAPLPRPAARLLVLAIMFAAEDVCCLSQQALVAEGFGKSLTKVLHALVEAGFVSRQVGTMPGRAMAHRMPLRRPRPGQRRRRNRRSKAGPIPVR